MVNPLKNSSPEQIIRLPSRGVEIACCPLLRSGFYDMGNSRSIPAGNTPITNISAREAKAFARRLGARLPTYDEIRELLKIPRGSPSRFHHPSAPTEWLNCAPEWEPAGTGMNCIASINGDTMALSNRGSLQDRRYPFVTFRIVKE